MTYFDYKRIRGSRGQRVYVGTTYVGRVDVVADWRARLSLNPSIDQYRAIDVNGDELPQLFPSRHDAAEALFEVTQGTERAS